MPDKSAIPATDNTPAYLELTLAIIESAQDAILMMDPEGRVSHWNPAAERIFGYTKDEAIGQNLHDLIVPARFHPAYLTAFGAFRQTGQVSIMGKTLELEARRKGGQELQVQLSLSAVRMNDGWHAVGLIRDITECMQAEEKLREKERLLSESQRLGHIGSFLYDMTGRLSWSDEVYRLCGVSPVTFTPTVESLLGLIHPDDRPLMQAWIEACVGGEKPAALDYRIHFPDGTIRYHRGYGNAVHDDKNGFLYLAGMVQDITERKRAEEALRSLTLRYKATLAAVPDIIIEVDNNKLYTWANKTSYEFFGDDVIGKEAAYYFEGEQKTYNMVAPLFNGNGSDEVIYVESWQRRKDGEKRLLAWCCRVLKDGNGNVTGALSSARDITEQTRVEHERNKMLLWQQGIRLIQQSLLTPAPLEDKLKRITDSIVRLFEADFCRIWLIRPGDLCERGCVHAGVQEGPDVCSYRDRCLHLLASSGRYTHIDGKVHRRVPFGAYKIGRIASNEDHKFLTNDVTNDPRVHNHEWASELGLVSFAGYQLRIPGEETLGVLALFAKHPLLPAEDSLLDALSSALAQAIQQAQGEAALRMSEFFLNKLLETIPIPVFYKDKEGRYLGFNKTFETFFGKSKEELIGKSVFDINPTELAKVYHAQDIKLFENPGVQVYDSQVRNVNGALRDVIFHKASLTDTQGSITGLVGAILDVTARKRAEQELQRYAAELEKKNKELQDALADVKQLTGMLPICMSCKRIRDDKGYWESVESYISAHSEAVFSHGVCPECEKKLYGDLDTLVNENARNA